MQIGGILLAAGVATARGLLALTVALGFWAAAPGLLGWMPTTVMTASMAPAILVGDVVVSRPLPREALVPGRVVLAVDPDWPKRLRLHRVTGIDGDGRLITKGDANAAADSSPLHPDAVQGVGVLRVPWVGLPAVWLRTGAIVPLSLGALGFAACLALALRRPDDDIDDPAAPPDARETDGVDARRPLTRRALRTQRTAPARAGASARSWMRRVHARATGSGGRRVLAAVVIAAATVGAASVPAWAALGASSAAESVIRADRVSPPTSLSCSSRFLQGVWVSWEYVGREPRSFDVLVDGRVTVTGIPPTAREVRVPNGSTWGLLRTSAITVRANVGRTWFADSRQSATVGSLLGVTYCA